MAIPALSSPSTFPKQEVSLPKLFPSWIDYSTLSSYITCPRKNLFQYVLSLRPKGEELPLVFGSSIHFALEIGSRFLSIQKSRQTLPTLQEVRDTSFKAFKAYWQEFATPFHSHAEEDLFPRSSGNARAMIGSHLQRTYQEDLNRSLVGTEIPIDFLFELPNQQKLLYRGRIDKVMMEPDGKRLAAFEYKTSSILSKLILDSFELSFQTVGYLRFLDSMSIETPMLFYDVLGVAKTKVETIRHEIRSLQVMKDSSFENMKDWILRWSQDWETLLSFTTARNGEDLLFDKTIHLPCFLPARGTACSSFMRPCIFTDLCKMRANPITFLSSLPTDFHISVWDPEKKEQEAALRLNQFTNEILA